MFQVWHPKNHIGKPDGNAPHIIGTTDSEAWETGEWSETGQGKAGRPIQIKAIGRRLICVRAMIGRSDADLYLPLVHYFRDSYSNI